jgi:hypothetical protein
LATVACSPGATGARMYLAGESARLLGERQSPLGWRVLGQLVRRLADEEEIPLANRQLLAGRMMWEWLEHDPRLAARSIADPGRSQPWEVGVRLLEREPKGTPDRSVQELRAVLRQYPVIQNIRRQKSLLSGLTQPKVEISIQKED